MININIPWKLIIQFVIALAITATIYFQWQDIKKLNQKIDTQQVNLKSYMQGVQNYYTKDSVLHTQSVTQQLTPAYLKANTDPQSKALIDSLSKWKIKLNQVTRTGQVITELHHDTVVKLLRVDTTVDLSDKHISETIAIKPDSSNPTSYKLRRQLDVNDTLTIISHIKHETIDPPKQLFFLRWFQKKHNVEYTDVTHSNPYMKIKTQKFVQVVK